MLTFLAIIHVIIGIGLIIFVLLQDPKDGAAGMFGGGSSSKSFFGASGATNFLTTTTKWLAIGFCCSCLLLTALATKKSSSVLDEGIAPGPAVPGTEVPKAPGDAPGTASAAPTGQQAAPAAPAAPDTQKHE